MKKPRLLAFVALTLLTVLLAPGLLATPVTETEEEVDRAKSQKQQAEGLLDDAVDDRAEIEADLVETITRLNQLSDELTTVSVRARELQRDVDETTAEKKTREVAARRQTTDAYIQAISSPSAVFLTTGVEETLVAEETISGMISESQSEINRVATLNRQLGELQAEMELEKTRIAELQEEVEVEVGHLEEVYAAADSDVADAIADANAADARYREALTDAERARAEEAARRREEERNRNENETPPTTTPGGEPPSTEPPGTEPPSTEPPTTEPPGTEPPVTEPPSTEPPTTEPPTTQPPPTTEPPGEEPPPGSGPGVEQWRSTVSAYFPAERVEGALRVMDCESNGDSSAYNPYSGASGLYQFIPSTWASASSQAGFGGASVFNGEANIGTAAWLTNYYANQGQDPWTPWSCKP